MQIFPGRQLQMAEGGTQLNKTVHGCKGYTLTGVWPLEREGAQAQGSGGAKGGEVPSLRQPLSTTEPPAMLGVGPCVASPGQGSPLASCHPSCTHCGHEHVNQEGGGRDSREWPQTAKASMEALSARQTGGAGEDFYGKQTSPSILHRERERGGRCFSYLAVIICTNSRGAKETGKGSESGHSRGRHLSKHILLPMNFKRLK